MISIAWSNKSSLSGRLILNELRSRNIRMSRLSKPFRKVLRWGFSEEVPNCGDILNSLPAIKACIDKKHMLEVLAMNKIEVPKFYTDNLDYNIDKGLYIRGKNNSIRFDTRPLSGDKYATLPVPYKRREYRLHIFDGQIFAMYEKLPHDNTIRPRLFKADNCKFSKVDPSYSICNEIGQSIAIKAVKALGLVYGAVDLIRTQNGKKYVVCEVNSSSGLNSENVIRLCDLIERKMKL